MTCCCIPESDFTSGILLQDCPEHGELARVWDALPICGCGNPEAALALIVKVLEIHPLYRHQPELNALLPELGAQMIVLGVLEEAGLTEHGGSIAGGWLTEEGKRFLELLADRPEWWMVDEQG